MYTNPENPGPGLALGVCHVRSTTDKRNVTNSLSGVLLVAVSSQCEGNIRLSAEVNRSYLSRARPDVQIVNHGRYEFSDVFHTFPLYAAGGIDDEHEIYVSRTFCQNRKTKQRCAIRSARIC